MVEKLSLISSRQSFFSPRRDVVEADQIDVFSTSVFGDLEKIKNAEKPGGHGERRRDIHETYRLYGVDLDLSPVVHTVAATDPDVWTQPEPNAAGDFPAADSFP